MRDWQADGVRHDTGQESQTVEDCFAELVARRLYGEASFPIADSDSNGTLPREFPRPPVAPG